MTRRYVVVGAGPVGRETAQLLRSRGEVTVVSRSGGWPSSQGEQATGLQGIALDASNADQLSELAAGAEAIFNCANPASYTSWERVWPPLAESLLVTAERTGATLVTASSLYAYGPVTEPMVEGQPDAASDHKGRLRAAMWADAKSRHDEERLRAVEVRASDYAGAGVGANGHLPRQVAGARRGKTAWVLGSPDQPHTWTDVHDVGRALVAVAERPDCWGRVWHAPSNPARSQRQALTDVLAADGLPPVPVRGYPRVATSLGGRLLPMMRELNEMAYMFERPYVMSSQLSSDTLGFGATPWPEVCRRTVQGN